MAHIFEITDKNNRKIELTKRQWTHIKIHHSEVEDSEEIKQTLLNPDKIFLDERENVENYFKFFKHKRQKSKFLKVVVKFLNTSGFIITAYYVRSIK